MRFNRKILMFLLLFLTAFVFIGCGKETTSTTEVTTAGTTVTTQEVTTEEPGSAPYFTGLFTKQTYYRGSQELDLLAGAKAIDAEDGELEIEIVGAYSATRLGTYNVFAVASDTDGNTIAEEIVLTVKDIDFTIPETLTTEDITIELWHSNGDTIETALKKYAAEFNAIYENITVEITKNGQNYGELKDNVVNAIRGGELPNIVQNYPDHVMEYINNEALITLTPYINHATWGYDTETAEESFLDILLSYRRENSQYTTDGEYYSVPFNKSTEVMIYNKDMVDALIDQGVISEVPTTWQDLFDIADDLMLVKDDIIDDIAAALNQSDNPSIHKDAEEIQSIKDNFVPFTYDSPANAFITLTRQWGGEYTTIDAQRQGVILFDNDEVRDMLSFFFDSRQTVFTVPAQWGLEYGSDAFVKGQTAFTIGSTGGARYNTPEEVNGEYVFEFGVVPLPYNEDMPDQKTAIQQGTNMSITTAGTEQEQLASWLFLKFLTSYDVQLDFALTTGYSPVRYSVYDDPIFIQFTQGLDEDGEPLTGEDLMKSKAANAAAEQASYLFFDQAYVGSSAARDAVEIAFENVMLIPVDATTTKNDIIENQIAAAVDDAEKVLSES